ncbi:cyclic nucleotide-binding domain-containing protein [Nostocoides sp. HKS02]|uniref:cyclic nucleotide-binding domain-containing protein n=1 Tax=Nostocoides sp. HKS02 TaxID=1813880 RepID=UPI0012B4B269|nr:cyclic nucleotide-binding domain-containing protein [Tetrasphaera sp. HKS02]QGN59226.1 cyclic nucleotide-binding domain-containing protein [Tetrasphaera sp. HKS02]
MKATQLEEHLSRIDLFHDMSDKAIRRLIGSGREVLHEDGHRVIGEGSDLAMAFHVVLDGHGVVTSAGVERRIIGPGDSFGEISLIDGEPRSATVIAQGPLRTFAIPREPFVLLLDDHPEIARGLLLVLCRRLRQAEASMAGS